MPYWLPTCAVYIYVRARKINIMTLILSRVGFYRTGSNESSPTSVLFVPFCVVSMFLLLITGVLTEKLN